MISNLCVPITGPLDAATQGQVRAHGVGSQRFDGVRIDVHPGEDNDAHSEARRQLQSFENEPAHVVFLIGPGGLKLDRRQLLQHTKDWVQKAVDCGYQRRENFAVEVGNEPDLSHEWKNEPDRMWQAFVDCWLAVRTWFPRTPVLSPSISNLNQRGFSYLERMVPGLPKYCDIAFHRYPAGPNFEDPHKGFASRDDEVERLKKLAGGRHLWCTEVGWAEQNRDYTLTEEQVAARMRQEYDFWRAHGVEGVCFYQINSAPWKQEDGTDMKRLNSYGARRVDGSWKPWAEVA